MGALARIAGGAVSLLGRGVRKPFEGITGKASALLTIGSGVSEIYIPAIEEGLIAHSCSLLDINLFLNLLLNFSILFSILSIETISIPIIE
jgi:hypothetical protein